MVMRSQASGSRSTLIECGSGQKLCGQNTAENAVPLFRSMYRECSIIYAGVSVPEACIATPQLLAQ